MARTVVPIGGHCTHHWWPKSRVDRHKHDLGHFPIAPLHKALQVSCPSPSMPSRDEVEAALKNKASGGKIKVEDVLASIDSLGVSTDAVDRYLKEHKDSEDLSRDLWELFKIHHFHHHIFQEWGGSI
ncbi:hypothetical protein TcWFU_002201 [Taenia crassiceps]|uniref:Uncharacterized protein n=1 Tax=Taenia crassiceps TaxID=6207 RepID=A0ABR4QCH5_9CEST